MSWLSPTNWTALQITMCAVVAVGFTALFVQHGRFWAKQNILWDIVADHEERMEELLELADEISEALREIQALAAEPPTDVFPAVTERPETGPQPTVRGLPVSRPPVPVPDEPEIETKTFNGVTFRIKRHAG